ncbi:elongation factor P 5-aminopentanone reductase [Sporosarcina luteola]|uniref:elongation factor P 5-aminopentanone reductase n=1 Tax=Sporosarcina luteola TaxID=582850 RepID=UPI00204019C4|nr:SDR family oxidoreductase [Sporosarcina luteola]MCM3709878.1 SDR family oxidoreductase [Sporosarcina luteola]
MTRHAVILGSSGGIGEAVSRKLADDGWTLYLHYNRNEERALDLQRKLTEKHPERDFRIVQSDFSKEDGAWRLAEQVGQVQAIVVALGQSVLKLLTDTNSDDMDALWLVHMRNPALFISLTSPQLRSHPVSYVLFIGSIWGNTGAAGEVMYSAVKGAQHAFVKAYAKEAAYTGTRVNAIAPGWIETEMNSELSLDDKQLVLDEIPLQSTGQPEQVADLASFLLSGRADYMTGEVLKLNGGWYI